MTRYLPPKLDSHDRAILRILQRDNKTTQRTIGELVHLSAAAVQRRIMRMEATGVITANVAMVDPRAIDTTITAIVEVQMINEHVATLDAAKVLFRATPEVQQCYYVTGGVSFALVITARDMPDYDAITRRLFSENPSVASFRSMIALDRVKSGSGLTIP